MVKVIQLADDGTEMAAIEVDDFTIEVIYSGLADMLRDAAAARPPVCGACLRPAAARRASAASGSSAASATDPATSDRPGTGEWTRAKGRAATLKRHAHLPGGHPRRPPGPRRG